MAITIEQLKKVYENARKSGNHKAMQQANDMANKIRREQGQQEQKATKDINHIRNVATPKASTKKPSYSTTGSSSSAKSSASSKSSNSNSHQDWINNPKSGQGGMDNYVKRQQEKYYKAVESGDQGMMDRVVADSKRVGYDLILGPRNKANKEIPTNNQVTPTSQEKPYDPYYDNKIKELIDSLSNNKSYKDLDYTKDTTYDDKLKELVNSLSQEDNTRYNDEIQDLIEKLPKDILDWDTAKGRADEQLGAYYDKNLQETLANIDKNALRTGFFGQLPTADYKQRNATEIEKDRAMNISQFANQLQKDSKADVRDAIAQMLGFDRHNQTISNEQFQKLFGTIQHGQSRDDVDWEKAFEERRYERDSDTQDYEKVLRALGLGMGRDDSNWEKLFREREYGDGRSDVDWEKLFKEREYQDSRSDIDWEKLFKEREYQDKRSDVDWEKGVTEAQLTGYYKDNPTMAYTKMSHDMGMDTKRMEIEEKKLNEIIKMNYETIKNNRTKLAQAQQRINQAGVTKVSGPSLTERKYMTSVKETARKMALEDMKEQGLINKNDDIYSIINSGLPSQEKDKYEETLLNLTRSYTDWLLGGEGTEFQEDGWSE